MYFLLTNSHCCTPTCAGLLMAVNCSLREQQEVGQTPADFHLSSSSYSTLATSLIQWVKAGVMLRKRPHVLVYRCMNWKEQHPEQPGAEHIPLLIQIGVLVGCWECSQDKLSRDLVLLRLLGLPALQRACALSKTWIWSEEQLWSCLHLVVLIHKCVRRVICAGPEMC